MCSVAVRSSTAAFDRSGAVVRSVNESDFCARRERRLYDAAVTGLSEQKE